MANWAENTVEVRFKNAPDLTTGDEVARAFDETFDCDEIYSENCDAETYYSFEAFFCSKRAAPLAELREFCDKYNVKIQGVSHEFAHDYVEAFQLEPSD